MNLRIIILIGFILVFPAGAEETKEVSTKIEDLKLLIATVAKADKVILHEGLPHPLWERSVLENEKKTKKTVTIAGWPFYAEPLPLKEGDDKKFLELLGNEKTYVAFRGEKKCGGFHPDYAIEWRVGKESFYVLVCFGCGEFKVYSSEKGVRTDIGAGDISKLLKPYRKNRPEPKE